MKLVKQANPTVSIVCAVIMLAVAIFFTVVNFVDKPLDRQLFAATVLLYVMGLGTLLREWRRKRAN